MPLFRNISCSKCTREIDRLGRIIGVCYPDNTIRFGGYEIRKIHITRGECEKIQCYEDGFGNGVIETIDLKIEMFEGIPECWGFFPRP